MSASAKEPVNLEQIGEILAGQSTVLGKKEQSLVALFVEIWGMSERVTQIQSLLQPQRVPPNVRRSSELWGVFC